MIGGEVTTVFFFAEVTKTFTEVTKILQRLLNRCRGYQIAAQLTKFSTLLLLLLVCVLAAKPGIVLSF